MERAIDRVGPKTAFVYRLARGSPAAKELIGTAVTPRGLMMNLQFEREPAPVPCELKAVVGPVAQAFCPWSALERLLAVPGLLRAEPTLDMKILRPMLPKGTTLDVT